MSDISTLGTLDSFEVTEKKDRKKDCIGENLCGWNKFNISWLCKTLNFIFLEERSVRRVVPYFVTKYITSSCISCSFEKIDKCFYFVQGTKEESFNYYN